MVAYCLLPTQKAKPGRNISAPGLRHVQTGIHPLECGTLFRLHRFRQGCQHILMNGFSPARRFVRMFFQLLSLLTLAFPAVATVPSLAERDIVFYYGSRPPVDDLRHFDQIVIQPSQVLAHERTQLLALPSAIFAYVSIGEVARNSEDISRIKSKWSIGTNPTWNSLVMDMSSSAWRDYLLDQHFGLLWQQGYRAFFLDTVDSYLLAAREGKRREQQEQGLQLLLAEVKRRYPGVKLLLNRGFEVLDKVAKHADGMIAESLFHGFDPLTGKHAPTKPETRQWLINQLRRAQDEFNLPVTVLDYVEPGEWAEAEKTAKQILELGFMPWVANGDLTWLGQGRVRLMPRRVLAIVDGSPAEQWNQPLFKHLATPLEYLGLAIDYWYIDQQGLPIEPLLGRYSGVVSWLPTDLEGRYGGVCSRLQREADAGLPVVLLGNVPAGVACRRLVGYAGDNQPITHALTAESAHQLLARPEHLPVVGSGTPDVRVEAPSEPWLTLSGENQRFHPVAVTASGGYAVHPHLINENASGQHQWLLDPVAFLRAALRLPLQPAFDLTTENGRRISLLEIRADQLFRTDAATGVSAYDKLLSLLNQYQEPVTIGIIEAEIRDDEQKQKVQQLAALPHVRLASHTYSHPFYWPVFIGERDADEAVYKYSVQVPGYAAELSRETAGTLAFLQSIDDQAAPLLMWSGDGKAPPAAVAAAEQGDMLHIGGGGLHWQTGALSLADLSPLLKPSDWGIQVLTPLVAEPLFARLWYGELLNYRKVIEWNQLLDGPQRWRPASLSLHADALLRNGAATVIDEAIRQQQREETLPLWLDEFVRRARSFQQASLARDIDGRWQVYAGELRTLRLPASAGLVAISNDVAGFREHHEQRYLHLTSASAELQLVPAAEKHRPLLIHASAPLQHWQLSKANQATFRLQARGQAELQIPAGCRVQINEQALPARVVQGGLRVLVPAAQAAEELSLDC